VRVFAIASALIIVMLFDCSRGKQEKVLSPIEQAIKQVSSPCTTYDSDPDLVPQTWKRLRTVEYFGYRFQESDRAAWSRLLTDRRASVYARLCAAYFLLDKDDGARRFVQGQLTSANLRYRYNAAQVLEMYAFHPPAKPFEVAFERDPSKVWAVDLLIEQISKGSLDGSGVTSGDGYQILPDGDWEDIMCTPIGDICRGLGSVKETNAVPALIKMVERQPELGRASWAVLALGEIGDARSMHVLLAKWKAGIGDESSLIDALGKLKCQEAVPLLIARLEKARTSRQQMDATPTRAILDALLNIGDKQAIPAIREVATWKTKTDPTQPPEVEFPNEYMVAAKLVLVQLECKDPVPALLDLLRTETQESRKWNLIRVLAKYRDDRVIEDCSYIAKNSLNATTRQAAIHGLEQIRSRRALLELATLLNENYPLELKDWFKVPNSDRPTYFRQLLVDCLKRTTKQDFGSDSDKWKVWIEENVND